jgi:Arc/MetJ family transcription regulator
MQRTFEIDDEQLRSAQELTGIADISELVREALTALVEREASRRLRAMGGSDPGASGAPRRRPDPEDR